MATTTNYGWTTPDDTALVKDGAAAIRTLGSSVDTTTKNLNPSTTLGDIEYRSSTPNVNTRLPLGTAGQVLKVNSGATAPEWATDASGMTNPMTTTGDTIYSSSGSTPARLAIGSTGNVLTVAGGVPTWAAPAASGITYSDWTPTLVNFTKGNGTFNFRYAQSGKAVFLDINIIFGSTTSMQASTISLPVAPKYYNTRVAANYLDAGTAFYSASCTIESAGGVDVLSLKAQKSDATYTTLVGVDTAVPFTWTTNDQINIQCVYEAA
jgi:hypothetical protein